MVRDRNVRIEPLRWLRAYQVIFERSIALDCRGTSRARRHVQRLTVVDDGGTVVLDRSTLKHTKTMKAN